MTNKKSDSKPIVVAFPHGFAYHHFLLDLIFLIEKEIVNEATFESFENPDYQHFTQIQKGCCPFVKSYELTPQYTCQKGYGVIIHSNMGRKSIVGKLIPYTPLEKEVGKGFVQIIPVHKKDLSDKAFDHFLKIDLEDPASFQI